MKDIDFGKVNVLLNVQQKAAQNGSTLSALMSEALAELLIMNEAAQENVAARLEEARKKEAEIQKKREAEAAKEEAEAAKTAKAVEVDEHKKEKRA